MASSTAPASHAEPLPGPPPTPTSLMDLPAPWRLQLATSSALDDEDGTLTALFSTCSFFRDAVLRNRTAIASFDVPLTPERFPAELERLCTVVSRSSRVCLVFEGDADEDEDGNSRPVARWIETEPHITHLLVCAAAQLGGEQPLTCVKEIELTGLEHTALVPAWVNVLCPNATKVDAADGSFPLDLPHPTMPQPPLQHLECSWHYGGPPTAEHIRQQLSALPSLSSLTLPDLYWATEEDEQQTRRLISSTITRLEATGGNLQLSRLSIIFPRLPTQFPRLRELSSLYSTVDDFGLEALLSMPHLEHLNVDGFRLTHSHTHRMWHLQHLTTTALDVESFARLPLESIQACRISWWVFPSTDAAAVARVAEAVRRWGGLGSALCISGSNVAAQLATLGPLIAALPAAQQRRVRIDGLRDATSSQVQQLGQRLPASITHLHLEFCTLAADAWPALLLSLPASVEEIRLPINMPKQQVLAMCQAAVRPIKVLLSSYGTDLSQQDLDRITRSLSRGPGGSGEQQQQEGSLVTLMRI